jgi:hypothetical protein
MTDGQHIKFWKRLSEWDGASRTNYGGEVGSRIK